MTMKCGLVALVGAPNVGKSTLLNALVGERVAIVSPKVNTTRLVVRGIFSRGETQLVMVDTPGLNTSTKGARPTMSDRKKERRLRTGVPFGGAHP